MGTEFKTMGFFTNRHVNFLNIHSGIRQFSQKFLDVFGILFLLEAGVPLWMACFVWCGMMATRLMVRPISLKLCQRFGLKVMTIVGTLFYSGTFYMISQIEGISYWVLLFMLYHAIADTLYWLPYHAWYAASGDHGDRGKQVSGREVLILMLSALSPLLGSVSAHFYGFSIAYVAGAAGMVLAVVPLLFAQDMPWGRTFTHRTAWDSIDRRSLLILVGDGLDFNLYTFIWPVVALNIVGNYLEFGWIFVFQIVLSAFLLYIIGNSIDNGRVADIARHAIVLHIIVILGRSLFVTDLVSILFFQVLYAIAFCLYTPVLNTVWYNLAKKSKNTLWFHYLSEIGWDIGGFVALLCAGTWVLVGWDIRYAMLGSIVGLFIVWKVINSYCKEEQCTF